MAESFADDTTSSSTISPQECPAEEARGARHVGHAANLSNQHDGYGIQRISAYTKVPSGRKRKPHPQSSALRRKYVKMSPRSRSTCPDRESTPLDAGNAGPERGGDGGHEDVDEIDREHAGPGADEGADDRYNEGIEHGQGTLVNVEISRLYADEREGGIDRGTDWRLKVRSRPTTTTHGSRFDPTRLDRLYVKLKFEDHLTNSNLWDQARAILGPGVGVRKDSKVVLRGIYDRFEVWKQLNIPGYRARVADPNTAWGDDWGLSIESRLYAEQLILWSKIADGGDSQDVIEFDTTTAVARMRLGTWMPEWARGPRPDRPYELTVEVCCSACANPQIDPHPLYRVLDDIFVSRAFTCHNCERDPETGKHPVRSFSPTDGRPSRCIDWARKHLHEIVLDEPQYPSNIPAYARKARPNHAFEKTVEVTCRDCGSGRIDRTPHYTHDGIYISRSLACTKCPTHRTDRRKAAVKPFLPRDGRASFGTAYARRRHNKQMRG